MLPHKHLAISTVIGAIGWWQTSSPAAMGVALATGVLPDLDHAVDYTYYYWRRTHCLIMPLHGYEYALVGAVVALIQRDPMIGIATLSYFCHLLADQTENRTKWLGYSILFRAFHRFRLCEISTMPEAAAQGRENDLRMLINLSNRLTFWRKK